MRSAVQAVDTGTYVVERLREQHRRRWERQELTGVARAAYLAAGGRTPTGGRWVWNSHRVTWVRDDCVVKVSRSAYGEMALRRDLSVRTSIHAQPAWAGWRHRVAQTLGEHRTADRFAVMEELLPGAPLSDLMHDPAVMGAVRDELGRLQTTTRHEVPADDRLCAWFLSPAATVSAMLWRRGEQDGVAAVTGWARRLADALEGTRCSTVLVHGDFWPGNVLLRRSGGPGVIDWDQASFHDAAFHDRLHLTVHPTCHERRTDLGLVVRALLDDPAELRALMHRSGAEEVLDDVGVSGRDALVWYWLRHVDRMSREPGHATNPRWVNNNVVAVATTLNKGRTTS